MPRPPASHGTKSKYTTGCRCDDCRRAARDYNREWYARKRCKQAAKQAPAAAPVLAVLDRAARRRLIASRARLLRRRDGETLRLAPTEVRAIRDRIAFDQEPESIALALGVPLAAVRAIAERRAPCKPGYRRAVDEFLSSIG